MAGNVKEAVIQMISELPNNVTISDIIAELYFRQKADKGLQQLDDGEGIDHKKVKEKLKKWIKK